jgi:hypothetical protein
MSKILMILQMVPAIIGIVKSVEEVFPEAGKGSEKLGLVREILSELYADITSIWDPIEKVIAVFVSWANRFGLFSKDDDTVIDPPTE